MEGFEPNEWKRSFAQSNGLIVHSSMNDFGERKVDMISLLNVYSHLSNPCDDFRRYQLMLNPNGRLLRRRFRLLAVQALFAARDLSRLSLCHFRTVAKWRARCLLLQTLFAFAWHDRQ